MFFLSLLSALVIGIVLFMVVMDIFRYRKLTKRDELSTYTKVVSNHVMDAGKNI